MTKNNPDKWRHLIPVKIKDSHKYIYGHALIYAAPSMTGATNLAASACARMGAGLVSVLADKNMANVYRTILPAHIIVREDLNYTDDKVTARLYGCGGLSVGPYFNSDLPTVLDADALKKLPPVLKPNYILTPHEGEFERAFHDLKGTAIERAQNAAKKLNAHIVLKGSTTVISAPNGNYIVNESQAHNLATAGTGDVLAGMITGLVAQHMPIFEASCAAVWIHGECARLFGPGLVASDLIPLIPDILKKLGKKSA